jgi:hypothetical protein
VNNVCNATGTCLGGVPNTCVDTDACTVDSCDEDMAACVNAQTPRDPGTCLVAPSTKFQITNSAKPGKDKLSWRWGRGDGFALTDLGTPNANTGYTLCVYDTAATVSSLKASIDIAPSATRWQSRDSSRLQYKDKSGASEGVLRAQLITGDSGKTKVGIGAGGPNLVLPAPAGASFFSQDVNVVVQLVNGAGACWTSRFTADDTRTNDAASFKAATK